MGGCGAGEATSALGLPISVFAAVNGPLMGQTCHLQHFECSTIDPGVCGRVMRVRARARARARVRVSESESERVRMRVRMKVRVRVRESETESERE